jgi:S-DNA-T family DNA segregation ATPase FtsK/SpoIIIE
MTRSEQRQAVRRGLVLLFSIAGCAFLWASLLSFSPMDWPSPNAWPHPEPSLNACGRAGAWVAQTLYHYFGEGAYPLALGATVCTVLLAWQGSVPRFWQRVFGVGLIVTVTSAAVYLVGGSTAAGLPENRGGILGIGVGFWMKQNFSMTGTVLILAYCLFVGVAFTAERLVARAPSAMRHMGRASGFMLLQAREKLAGQLAPTGFGAGGAGAATLEPPRARRRGTTTADAEEDEEEEAGPVAIVKPDQEGSADDTYEEDDDEYEDEEDGEEDEEEDDSDAASEPGAKPPIKVVNLRPLMQAAGATPATAGSTEPYPKELGEWEFPPTSLLNDPEYLYSVQQEEVVRGKAQVLEKTLEEFRIQANVVQIDTGPVITMFELSIAPGVKVSQIAALANDMARALKASAVRIVAPIPGKNTVGVEVPNNDKETVRMKELITLAGAKSQRMSLPLFLGKDASGNALVADLATMPHMLIAGTTGSGKSVCINAIIMSLLLTRRPDMVKLILVDPKMVELTQFKEVPHLMCPIITDMARAEKILEWAVTKMDERYELLAEAGVRNIAAYNRLSKDEIYERFQPGSDEEKAKIPTHQPHIVIIIDELADLMMTSAKEVEHHLSRLAQKSRAVGIHIIVATQRPEVKVVTGLIKSNLPCRIAFRVSSRMDSRIVMDQNGAEVLMGQGDALFLPPGSAKLIRMQGTFLEENELREVIKFLADRSEPEFHPELVRLRTDDSTEPGERDPLFDEAVRTVIETRRGSVSLLQRRLTIGYSRASRLIEQMAEAGIVGTYKGSQAREVTITMDEWDAWRKQMQQELAHAGYAADADDDDAIPDLLDGDNDLRD